MSNNSPTFTVYTGPMFSSKSSKMLLALERFKYQHKDAVLFKPVCDVRYSKSEVVTHGGWSHEATVITSVADIIEALAERPSPPQVVAVDEAFMIPGIAETLIWLYRNGFSIVVSSLDLSAQGKPFTEIEKMLPWATHIKKCSAVCTACGRDAHYTHKKIIDENSEEIQVGGAELYEPRCGFCHPFIFSHDVIIKNVK